MTKELITIRRENIDVNDVHGFIISESKNLLMIQYVYDFNLDGILVLSKDDITEINSSKTDKFQTQLLKDEGIFEKVLFRCSYKLDNWRDFISSVKKKHKYIICEEERLEMPSFIIGKILDSNNESFQMKHFSGIAKWRKEPVSINYRNLTSCQIGSNYLNMYENYFKRNNA